MKPTSRIVPLNPAFKRFQLLPGVSTSNRLTEASNASVTGAPKLTIVIAEKEMLQPETPGLKPWTVSIPIDPGGAGAENA
jgi:hypothetical protein